MRRRKKGKTRRWTDDSHRAPRLEHFHPSTGRRMTRTAPSSGASATPGPRHPASTDQDCSRHLHAPNSHPPETDPLQHPIGGSKWTHHPLSPLDSLGFSVCPESVRGVCVPTAKAGNPGTRGFSKGAIPQAHARMARNLGNRAVCRRLQAAWGRLLSHRFAGCRAGRSSSRAPTGPFPRGAKNSGPISKRA